MAIPDYESIMLPLLQFADDGEEHSLREAYDKLADYFNLSQDERKELLPSGQQEVFHNRVGWARTFLKKAGILESTRRGYLRITKRGLDVLGQNLNKIDNHFLEQYEEFRKFKSTKHKKKTEIKPSSSVTEEATPEEALEGAYEGLRDNLISELLEQLKASSSSLFEKIVVELLVKMGYGGTRKDAGKAIGGSGDEGIDGIIKEDRLGLDIIYIQAKKWDNTVGRPEIQKFAGALQGQRARKGIFITTSNFSREAYEYASRIDSKIVLIDGDTLAQLMIDNNLGVSLTAIYEIKRIDSDYFTEE
jgi:restriction system protein